MFVALFFFLFEYNYIAGYDKHIHEKELESEGVDTVLFFFIFFVWFLLGD